MDLDTTLAKRHHPKGTAQAYVDIRLTLANYALERAQGSTHAADHEDYGKLFLALTGLRDRPWVGASLRNIRVFRMEQGTDFITIMKTRR
jgi:virulence-associated protein VapD